MARNALPFIPRDALDFYKGNFSVLGCQSRLPQLCCECDLESMKRRAVDPAIYSTISTLIYLCATAVGNAAEHEQIQMLFQLINSPQYEPKIRPKFPGGRGRGVLSWIGHYCGTICSPIITIFVVYAAVFFSFLHLAAPAVVTLGFNILSIDDLDIKDMGFTVDLFLNQQWYDERLQHSHCTYLDAGLFVHQIWIPDTYFVESKRARFHQVTDKNIMIKVFPNGKIYYSARLSVRVSCAMDFRKFPMDIQKCPLSIESYGYGKDQIIYQWENKSSYTYTVQSNAISQYDLKPMIFIQQTTQYVIGEWSTLKVIFVFDRKSSIFIPGMYFPCAVVVIISWITFFLEPDHFPARTSLCVTAVLTIVTIEAGINRSLPKVSYVKMIDLYVLVCILFVSGVFLEYAIILLIKEKKRKFYKKQIEELEKSSDKLNAKPFGRSRRRYHTDFYHEFCRATGESMPFLEPDALIIDPREEVYKDQLKQMEKIEGSSKFYLRDKWPRVLDHYSRVLFPLFFVGFNAVYWLWLH